MRHLLAKDAYCVQLRGASAHGKLILLDRGSHVAGENLFKEGIHAVQTALHCSKEAQQYPSCPLLQATSHKT